MPLVANTTDEDCRRAIRVMLAWMDGDRLAFDVALAEADAEPAGLPGLIFALLDYATSLGQQATPDFAQQLRATLLLEPDADPGEEA